MLSRPDIVGAVVCVRCACCAFREIPPETFSPGVFYFLFLKIPPLPLSYPRGDRDRFAEKNTHPPAGGTQRIGYYGNRRSKEYVIDGRHSRLRGFTCHSQIECAVLLCLSDVNSTFPTKLLTTMWFSPQSQYIYIRSIY